MCYNAGQLMIKNAIHEQKLTGVIVAACSPHMHENTFRKAVNEAGLNPFLCEMANIREHCSWVHTDKEAATQKAIGIVRMMVEKVRRNSPLEPVKVPVTRRAMVIGGGIAGIQAALDIANGGHDVVLVERSPSLGGHMAQLSETFPTLDCSQCILTPRMVECYTHPKIRVITYAEVAKVEGFVGNFRITVRQKARSVNTAICTGCGACLQKCPVKDIPSEFDEGLSMRRAIYVPFPQAVPNIPVIDREHCLKFTKGKCGICAKMCPRGGIDYAQQDTFEEISVGAVVVATGFQLLPRSHTAEFGKGKYQDVIDGLQFERLASASGPTGGEIRRPSDGKVPETVVFLKCIGSRDRAKGYAYCSKICCMYTAKHAMLYKHKVHHGQAIVFYMDVRAGGKGYDEFYRRAVEEDDALYLRGRVSKIYPERGHLVVQGADTLSGQQVEVEADMVVLASAVRPSAGATELCQQLSISFDQDGFINEAHPKLRPVETNTAGIFLAGACQAPKDIPEAVAQASAAAAKALGLFSKEELERAPYIASVNRDLCVHCRDCIRMCPYKAINDEEIRDRAGRLIKVVAKVNEGLCQGCGVCVASCRSGCIDLKGFTDDQIYGSLMALLEPANAAANADPA